MIGERIMTGQKTGRDPQENRYGKSAARKRRRGKGAIKRFCLLAAVCALCLWGVGMVRDMVSALLSGLGLYASSVQGQGAKALLGGDLAEYSEELVELLEKNGETLDFVSGYPSREEYKNAPIDLSGDFVSGEVPLLMQWDRRWGYDGYGDSMIGLAGCGPVCLDMAYLYFTGDTDMTPREMAQFAYDEGYYTEVGTSWSFWTEGAKLLGLDGEELCLDENMMKRALDSGGLIVCSMRPGDFTTTGHFILLKGYDEEGFRVNDPNRRSTSGKAWDYETLRPQIKNLWVLRKK